MAKRRRRGFEERENHERWLVSYADFITLLFAAFAVMYAISSLNEGRYRVLSNALSVAFGKFPATTVSPAIAPIIAKPGANSTTTLKSGDKGGAEKLRRETRKMQDIADRIMKVLEPLIRNGQVRVSRNGRGVSVEINASVLFAPAQAILQPESIDGLKTVADVLKSIDEVVQIEGHTDDTPISNPQFPSNWELSSARAISVVHFFINNGVAPQRLVATGYADYRPVTKETTPEARARNRRVTLLILSESATAQLP